MIFYLRRKIMKTKPVHRKVQRMVRRMRRNANTNAPALVRNSKSQNEGGSLTAQSTEQKEKE